MGDVPVLVETGSATTAHDLRSFTAVHAMRKPLNWRTVIATVHTLVTPRQARGQIGANQSYANRTGGRG
jgi:anthranilate phosphoribosyltransferase